MNFRPVLYSLAEYICDMAHWGVIYIHERGVVGGSLEERNRKRRIASRLDDASWGDRRGCRVPLPGAMAGPGHNASEQHPANSDHSERFPGSLG